MEIRKLDHTEILKVADAAAGSSIALFGVSLVALSSWVTIVAGAVAIIAGLAAAWFHIEGALQKRRQRKRRIALENSRNAR